MTTGKRGHRHVKLPIKGTLCTVVFDDDGKVTQVRLPDWLDVKDKMSEAELARLQARVDRRLADG